VVLFSGSDMRGSGDRDLVAGWLGTAEQRITVLFDRSKASGIVQVARSAVSARAARPPKPTDKAPTCPVTDSFPARTKIGDRASPGGPKPEAAPKSGRDLVFL